MRKIISFTSEFDGTTRQAILTAPDDAGQKPLPLVIVPHAAGWTGEATAGYWRDVPIKYGVMAVFPFGHGKKLDLRSMGWRGQMMDLVMLPMILPNLGYPVDASRVYAAGISMGGQESLLLSGRHPGLLAGVISFNAVMDLSTWFYDNETAAESMMEEIGGTPEELPREYAERSPITYADTIALTPTLLYWDPNDDVVQFQEKKQSGLLYRMVKKISPDVPILTRRHNRGHTYISPRLALDWLLQWERGASGVTIWREQKLDQEA